MVATSDLATDQRIQRHAKFLASRGYHLTVIGRRKNNSLDFHSSDYKVLRLNSWINKGYLFYVSFNIKLFAYLLFNKADVIWANDLDTLLPAYLVSKLKSKVLIYDTHEYFTGVPELQNRPFVRSFWCGLEKWLLAKVRYGMTVSESVAQRYKEEYGLELVTIRNIAAQLEKEVLSKEIQAALPKQPFILYQGALNKDRGLEELIVAMRYLKEYALVIAGKGDVEQDLKELADSYQLSQQVVFLGMLSPSELRSLTAQALVGVSIEKPTNPNYIMCLPNKLFDYIESGIPIIAYPHREIKNIIDTYQCGAYISTHEPEQLAAELRQLLSSERYEDWKQGSQAAAQVLNWENEKEVLDKWFKALLSREMHDSIDD